MGTVDERMTGSVATGNGGACAADRQTRAGGTLRTMAWGLGLQGASQTVAAVCFLLLASDKYSPLGAGLITLSILFIQWQVFGLTIAKLGVEQQVFAAVSRNPGLRFDAWRHVIRRTLPLAVLFSLLALAVFPAWAAPIFLISIVCDTWSLMLISDHNARGQYGVTAAANLLNYPLFFALLFGGAMTIGWSPFGVLLAFSTTSIVRWLYLVARPTPPRTSLVVASGNLPMGVQQALNFGLFRLDELLLAMIVLGAGATMGREFVFQARFPQLISIIVVLSGVVVFPHFYLECGRHGRPRLCGTPLRASHLVVLAVIGVVGLFAMNIVYRRLLWAEPTTLPSVPFVLHACAVLPVNVITYSMLRQGCLLGLLRNLACSLAVGGVYLAVARLAGCPWTHALAWLSAIQLTAMIAFSFMLPWGTSRNAYEETV